MPFVQIYLLEGRSEDKKRLLIERITQTVVEVLEAPTENVRVWIHDMPKGNWGIGGKTAKDLGR
jgi:4-oxalocrotonate tautomerase